MIQIFCKLVNVEKNVYENMVTPGQTVPLTLDFLFCMNKYETAD